MNLLIRNIEDLDSSYYSLKNCLTDYFLAMACSENPVIVKFYGANVNPELLKQSINNLFELLLKKHSLLDQILINPSIIHEKLNNVPIYQLIIKKF